MGKRSKRSTEARKTKLNLTSEQIAGLESSILRKVAERHAKPAEEPTIGEHDRNVQNLSKLTAGRKGMSHDRSVRNERLMYGKSDFDKDPHDKDPHDKDAGNFDRNNFDRNNFDRN